MNQIIEQTNDEKAEMYMKLEKIEIIDMLIEANRLLDIKNLNLANIKASDCFSCEHQNPFNEKCEPDNNGYCNNYQKQYEP